MKKLDDTELRALKEIFKENRIDFDKLKKSLEESSLFVNRCKAHAKLVQKGVTYILERCEIFDESSEEEKEKTFQRIEDSDTRRREHHEAICEFIFGKPHKRCCVLEILKSERIIFAIAEIF